MTPMYSWDGKESKAALSESQRDSVFELASLTEQRGVSEPAEDGEAQPREEVQEIQIASQFYAWLAQLEDEMDAGRDASGRAGVEGLRRQRGKCASMLGEIDACLGQLGSLRASYTAVSTKTNALHEACEHLLADQTALIDKARCLEQSVSFFNSIDAVALKLDAPNLRLTLENYVQIFNDLDASYRHLQNHTEYKEYGAYMSRLRSCLARTLALLRSHVNGLIDAAVSNVADQREVVSGEDSFTSLYGKFRASGARVHALMEVVEERVETVPEYRSFALDSYRYFLSRRDFLLRPVIARAVADLVSRHPRDHCSFLRAGLALLLHLCEDERRLFAHFFAAADGADAATELAATLDGLCAGLYEAFRPQLIHVLHVETLAEMCALLQEELTGHEDAGPGALPAYAALCRGLLADVRERLVFRSHIYMRSQILNFAPAPGDLAYPDKLRMMLSISAAAAARPGPDDAQFVNGGGGGDLTISSGPSMPLSPADLHGMWYPTVRRALVCLSKLSRCLDTTTFQGLSQECLSLCVQSLVAASGQISRSKSSVDGQLFLIKHLLILREQVAPFQLDFAVRETTLDFTKLKDAAYGLLSARSRLWQLNRSNALLKFVLDSTPEVMENVMDSKKEVDLQLKSTCDLFIREAVSRATLRLADFLQKAHSIEQMNAKPDAPQISLVEQPFAAAARVQDLVAESTKLVRQGLAALRDSLHVYLYNPDLEYILFRPVRQGVTKAFRELADLVAKYYSEEDRLIIACPTEEQLSLIMQS